MCIVQQPPCRQWRPPGDLQPRAEEEWKPRPQIKTRLDDFVFGVPDNDSEEQQHARRLQEVASGYHTHRVAGNECSSVVIQRVEAPVSVVWSLVRRFGEPQSYKPFVVSCSLPGGRADLRLGCLREIRIASGLPATTSIERLDVLDEERHIVGFSVVGGDHRLANYRSITSLHEAAPPCSGSRCKSGRRPPGSVVVESYAVEVPRGNTEEDTCLFVDTIIKCNLRSLARVSQSLAMRAPP